jgi:hypothetical protein
MFFLLTVTGFCSISPDSIDHLFSSLIAKSVYQFASPNSIVWSLNVSTVFAPFPQNIFEPLIENVFNCDGVAYYNVTLLDSLVSQTDCLAVPEHGYLLVFMWIPDDGTSHSWFCDWGRPDLFLNITYNFSKMPDKRWILPSNFGGMHRILYFASAQRLGIRF